MSWNVASQHALGPDFYIFGQNWPLKAPIWTRISEIAIVFYEESEYGGSGLPGALAGLILTFWPKVAAQGADFDEDR